MKKSRSYIANPPGVTIKEQLAERKMKQKEFAVRMGMSEKHISKLINGEVHLTIETARRLEMVLGIPAQFWCSLENIYREKLLKIQEENQMDQDLIIAQKVPYREMVINGWIENTENWSERVIILRKYFEIAQLEYLKQSLLPRIACRTVTGIEKNDLALLSWIQKARLEARNIKTKSIDVRKINKNLSVIKTFVKSGEANKYSELIALLAECGVAFVMIPQIETVYYNGATFVDGDKVVLCISKNIDNMKQFGFSVFHELAHIIYGHIWKIDGTTEDDEICADKFAKKMWDE